MNIGKKWTNEELQSLSDSWKIKPEWVTSRDFSRTWGKSNGRSENAVKGQIDRMVREGRLGKQYVQPSPYPVYDEPLVMEGDAIVLPDLEFPFHHSDFTNRVLELAEKWGIKQCVLAGDVLHFDSLSSWGAEFSLPKQGGITASAEAELMKLVDKLPPKERAEFAEKIIEIGERTEEDGLSTELKIARKNLHRIGDLFDKVDFLMGNHEGRIIRALETALDPTDLLRLMEKKDGWRIAPFYFSYLDTNNGRFQIEHPKGAAEGTAQQLAAKYHAHIIMAHSHLLDFTWDISGKFHAIHTGCCVDEMRLPYAAQRHVTKRAHKLGATIVRNGYPYLLHEGVDWKFLGRA